MRIDVVVKPDGGRERYALRQSEKDYPFSAGECMRHFKERVDLTRFWDTEGDYRMCIPWELGRNV